MSIFNEKSLEKLEIIRKTILKVGIWTLIGGVAMGAILILVGNSSSGTVLLKVMGTMFIVTLMLMISANNFRRLASEKTSASIFALVGLVSNLIWALLWTILCWNPEAYLENSNNSYSFVLRLSMLAKLAISFSYLSALGLIGSNIMSIYEGKKRSAILPLKITATVCATYEMIYCTIMVFKNLDYSSEFEMRMGALAGFAGFVWIVILIAALVISKGEKNKKANDERLDRERKAEKYEEAVIASAGKVGSDEKKSEEALRAEIEEKVRREMIEKEVRTRVEAEMKEKTEKENAEPKPEA